MALQKTPFWLFNLAYMAFLLPVIICLVKAYLGDNAQTRMAPLPLAQDPIESVMAAAFFLSFALVLYVIQRRALATLGWKQGEKLPAQHKDDFVRMTYLNISLLLLGRINGRLLYSDLNALQGFQAFAFCALVTYFVIFFSVLFEMVRTVNLQISLDLLDNPKGLWILGVGVLVLNGVLHAHVVYAFRAGHDFGCAYLAWVALVLLGHASVNLISPALLRLMDGQHQAENGGESPGDKIRLHVHHWYWAFVAAHFPVFDTALSFVAQAIFLAVYIHGAACFGLEPIFESNKMHAKES